MSRVGAVQEEHFFFILLVLAASSSPLKGPDQLNMMDSGSWFAICAM